LATAGYKVPVQATNLQKVLINLTFGGGVHNSAQEQRIVALAHQYMGTPYVWGGRSPRGFDCSGFAEYLYGKVGISIPRTTYTQWTARNGRAVKKSQLQPGDLVFFRGSDSKGGLPGHVGVYIGNGKMIDAPHTGADVRIDDVFSFGGYMGARRYH
jgi:cell wall-associated NlpC family hydrolase